jgi:hypothetical protein
MSTSNLRKDVQINVGVNPKPKKTVDTTSIASSDFEEVRLEDIETASEEVDWNPSSEEEMNSKRSSPEKKGVVGKNATAPVPSKEIFADRHEENDEVSAATSFGKSDPSSEITGAETTLPSATGGNLV